MPMPKQKQYLIFLSVVLFGVAGWFFYSSANDRGESVPADMMTELERRTKEFVCDACGQTKTLPALEFMAQTSSVALMGKTICKDCQDAGDLSESGPANPDVD